MDLEWDKASRSVVLQPAAVPEFRFSPSQVLCVCCVMRCSFNCYEFPCERGLLLRFLDHWGQTRLAAPPLKRKAFSSLCEYRIKSRCAISFLFLITYIPHNTIILFLFLCFFYDFFCFMIYLYGCLAWLELETWCLNVKCLLFNLSHGWVTNHPSCPRTDG